MLANLARPTIKFWEGKISFHLTVTPKPYIVAGLKDAQEAIASAPPDPLFELRM